ncbi:MAG: HEPN domain-containing protein [Gammaproteobacteria bacterium]|nr:HEPN domain-containing protein [Gammaproteobacteria bacterium]MBU1968788.1 HEPN domain-containing protein [Gammaproteobacteria bacterium]
MTPAIEEARRYLQLADDDAAAFRALLKLPEIKFRLACFHAQQAVEKTLKAVLTQHGIDYRRTHDLHTLADMLLKNNVSLPCTPEELTRLNPFAVTFRYDDTDIPLIAPAEVERMVDSMRRWASEVVK